MVCCLLPFSFSQWDKKNRSRITRISETQYGWNILAIIVSLGSSSDSTMLIACGSKIYPGDDLPSCLPWEPISFGGQCAKTLNCKECECESHAVQSFDATRGRVRWYMGCVVTRLYLSPSGCAISLIQFGQCYTPIYCTGTMLRRAPYYGH